jgi:DNA-binding SARP family transcriptional activator
LHIAEKLKTQDDPANTCQLLLISAVLQSRSGDNTAALNNAQAAWTLAERHGLPQAAWWADWGISSLSTHQGHYSQAAEHLRRLQLGLSEHNEWVLSNIVTTIRQALMDHTSGPAVSAQSLTRSLARESILSTALDWLLRWGESPLVIEASHHTPGSNGLKNNRVSSVTNDWLAPAQNWRALRRAARRAITFKLQSRRVETTIQPSRLTSPVSTDQLYLDQASDLYTRVPSSDPSSPCEPPAAPTMRSRQVNNGPSLTVYCLGTFRVYVNERFIEKWPGNKCKHIFKYLLVHRKQPIHQEVLMDLFWPDVDPESARRNLYQAIYNLRQALQNGDDDYPHILCEDSCYLPNPDAEIWIDSEAFRLHYQTGQQMEREGCMRQAIEAYEQAENLYGGEFLAEDRYEDWLIVHRENLKHAYLDILDRLSQYYFDQAQFAMCIAYCQKILVEDTCREDAHRRLMRCYMSNGQRHLALRQYHTCVEALKRELDVPPMPATIELYRKIQENLVQFPDTAELR